MDWKNLGKVTATSAVAITALQVGTAVAALPKQRRDYVDGIWGPGLAAVAVTGAVVGNGDPVRRWSLAALTSAWAVRLTKLMVGRIRSKDEEDPRYTEFLDGDSTAKVVVKVFVTQGAAQLLVSLPLQFAAASALPRGPRRLLFPLGLATMVAGGVIEAVADRQKDAFMERKQAAKDAGQDAPTILDEGLWAVSRHPNYFGDSVFWDGAWLAGAASAPAWLTVPAPAAMSYFLMFATGAKRTEKRMQDRPGFADYQDRVPFFFPLVGRRGRV